MIILRGQKALKAQKYDFTLHPESKKLIKRKASSHVPDWQKQQVDEIDYSPSVPKPRRSRKKKGPVLPPQSESFQEFTYDTTFQNTPEDDLSEEFLEEDDFLTPIDKDSIMS